jgi:hypothetical protein
MDRCKKNNMYIAEEDTKSNLGSIRTPGWKVDDCCPPFYFHHTIYVRRLNIMGAFVLGMKLYMCVCVCVYKSLPKAYMVYLVLFLSYKGFWSLCQQRTDHLWYLTLAKTNFQFFLNRSINSNIIYVNNNFRWSSCFKYHEIKYGLKIMHMIQGSPKAPQQFEWRSYFE